MRSNYKPIGNYIRRVEKRNGNMKVTRLLGLSMTKEFRETTSNIVGTDMSVYKVMEKWQFACDFMSPIRVNKLPVVLKLDDEPNLVSPAYPVFEIIDKNKLDPEYLMMWFRRSEFDRYAAFKCDSAIRGGYDWDELCATELPIPHIDKQREIVKEYHTIVDRINLNNQLIQKLEETAQAIYKQWFVDFEFPDEEGKPYKSNGGEMEWNGDLEIEVPKGWEVKNLNDVATVVMGQSPAGDTYNMEGIGTPLLNGPVEFGEYFPVETKWTNKPTRLSKPGDLMICVRGSTIGRFVKSDGIYCLGRGVGIIRAPKEQQFIDQFYKWNLLKFQGDVTGSTFPNWDKEMISQFELLVPQKKTIKDFEEIVSIISGHLELKHKEKILMQKLKSILLSKLATIEN